MDNVFYIIKGQDGEPYEMVIIGGRISRSTLQQSMDRYCSEYKPDCCSEFDPDDDLDAYVLKRLREDYHVVVLPWSSDDFLSVRPWVNF